MIKSGILLIAAVLAASLHPLSPALGAEVSELPDPTTGFSSRCIAPKSFAISMSSRCNESWTTLAEERAFLREVDIRSDRATLERYGTSGEGRGLYDLVIGDEANPVFLMVCSQHGPELAPRESCLRKAGELALSEDEGVRELLSKVRFVFAPTANPDGALHGTRGLIDGANANRHHADLAYPETRGIAELFERFEPIAAMDTHEMDSNFSYDIAVSEPKNPDVDPAIRDLSLDIMGAIARRFDDVSPFVTGDYELPTPTPQVLGNQIGLRFAVGGLLETRMNHPRGQRVWMQDESFDVVAAYVADNVEVIERVTGEARQRATTVSDSAPVSGDVTPDAEVQADAKVQAEAEAQAEADREAQPSGELPPTVSEPVTPDTPLPSPTATPTPPHSSTNPQAIAPTPTPSEGAHRNIEGQVSASSLALLLVLILIGVIVLALVTVVILRRHPTDPAK